MPRDQSVAPKERINIVYKPKIGDAQEEKELPLKLLILGDFTQRPDERPVEDRKPIKIDKDTYNQVLAEQKLSLSISVPDRLSGKTGNELSVDLHFGHEKDFGPEAVAQQVPELRMLLEIREALKFLRGPLGNRRAFRQRIEQIIKDPKLREKLLEELNIPPTE